MSDLSTTLSTTVQFHTGGTIPQMGLGVFQVKPDETERVVRDALEVGYRHIDTAAGYSNEDGVGRALRASGLDRDDVFVTTKLRNGEQGFDSALRAYDASLERLGMDAVDLYLIHWPYPAAGLWQETWRAFEKLLDEGRVRAIGVSNFMPEHIEELAAGANHLPVINQVELHPGWQQRDVQETCRKHGIAVQAYSPLGQTVSLELPEIVAIAEHHDVTPAQVVLKWHMQHDVVVIPKTTSKERMVTNASLDGLVLSDEEMARIDALDGAGQVGNDPREFNYDQMPR